MKTKNAILVGAVVLLSAGALSNLQWSMDKYGLLSSSLSKQVLALSDSDTSDDKDKNKDKGDTGLNNEKGFKEKQYAGVTKKITKLTGTSITVGGSLGIKGEVTKTTSKTETQDLFLNKCVGEGDWKDCVSSWDETPLN